MPELMFQYCYNWKRLKVSPLASDPVGLFGTFDNSS